MTGLGKRPNGASDGMTLREKALYHQIHPAKLATDILSEPISLYFFWRHSLWLGLATHFLPAIAASALVMTFVDLGPLKASRLGRYIGRHMTRSVEGARLVGDLVMVAGAWLRLWVLIAAGLAIVAAAWLSGRVLERRAS
ncbi:MAG TPA: hypothetical protein VN806_10090 [Caulobacteraceae bacterium]|nr:hypothetical protein [Caulobacteraceae bacterium]